MVAVACTVSSIKTSVNLAFCFLLLSLHVPKNERSISIQYFFPIYFPMMEEKLIIAVWQLNNEWKDQFRSAPNNIFFCTALLLMPLLQLDVNLGPIFPPRSHLLLMPASVF